MQNDHTLKKQKLAAGNSNVHSNAAHIQSMSGQMLSANVLPNQMKKPSSVSLPSDSAGGSSCHQCKSRRTNNDLTYCTSHLDKKKKSCRKKYCEHCMQKFYKESPNTIDKNKWRCPACRKVCCCAACRRKEERKAGIHSSGGAGGAPQHQHQHQHMGSSGSGMMAPQSQGNNMYMQHQQHSHSHQPSGSPQSAPSHHSHAPMFNAPSPMQYSFDVSPAEVERSAESMAGMAEYISSQAQNQCFALLYAVANLPNVNKHIQYYLARKDITDGQKVESIANLLRSIAPRTS